MNLVRVNLLMWGLLEVCFELLMLLVICIVMLWL